MKTCFGYVRVSTAKQGEGVSLEAQQEAMEDKLMAEIEEQNELIEAISAALARPLDPATDRRRRSSCAVMREPVCRIAGVAGDRAAE